MSQTRIMSIHRLLMRLLPAFCGGKALNENVKHFVFDLTCDVTGDLEVKFLNFVWKVPSRPFHCRLNFSPRLLVSEIDRGPLRPPPPPPQRVGAGLGPAGRGLTLCPVWPFGNLVICPGGPEAPAPWVAKLPGVRHCEVWYWRRGLQLFKGHFQVRVIWQVTRGPFSRPTEATFFRVKGPPTIISQTYDSWGRITALDRSSYKVFRSDLTLWSFLTPEVI